MLIRNTLYNLFGLGAPLIVAVVSIPPLISHLGTERFGLLTLIWAVVSYFGLFDLGLGRALTQQLAIELAHDDHSRVKPLVGTATWLMAGLGILAGLVLIAAAPWGIGLVEHQQSRDEVFFAVCAMAVAMPFIVLTSGFRGVLEARQAFGIVNLIRLPMGLFTFLGPLAVVLHFGPRLDWVAWVLVIGRIVACVVHAYYAWCVLPDNAGSLTFSRHLIKPLITSGGWMTVSNVVGPLMGYLDRFAVGALVSAGAVAYYATPQELIMKLSILPAALMSVMFPTFAKSTRDGAIDKAGLFGQSAFVLFLMIAPACAAIGMFSDLILSRWISADFSAHAAGVLILFACGMLINSVSSAPLTWLQATDKARVVAMIHTIELPLFFGSLWIGLRYFGIQGAAVAWVARIALDALFLWTAAVLCDGRLMSVALRSAALAGAATLAIYLLSVSHLSLITRGIVLLALLIWWGVIAMRTLMKNRTLTR
ncbi:polysaccharide biosynthesis protein [Pandoraea horticolens]|uniref:Polysaccharide biosynthesis protein n=1 Tax=Pandoraea horticolens TaxID=2508298 RepID=A0A5E4V349_9BURK|nr:flippase [Pandoraea horticolens]VVE06541.1 polysaccharide biosynthesis protein [Pandoraea horticolens]